MTLTVTIAGHTYKLACEPGDEARLEALAEELDRTMDTLAERLGASSERQIAVLAGLTVLDRLDAAEREARAAEARARTAEAAADRLSRQVASLEREREARVLADDADDEDVIARIDAVTATVDALAQTIVRAARRADHDAGGIDD